MNKQCVIKILAKINSEAAKRLKKIKCNINKPFNDTPSKWLDNAFTWQNYEDEEFPSWFSVFRQLQKYEEGIIEYAYTSADKIVNVKEIQKLLRKAYISGYNDAVNGCKCRP